jgi:hypothetical protein
VRRKIRAPRGLSDQVGRTSTAFSKCCPCGDTDKAVASHHSVPASTRCTRRTFSSPGADSRTRDRSLRHALAHFADHAAFCVKSSTLSIRRRPPAGLRRCGTPSAKLLSRTVLSRMRVRPTWLFFTSTIFEVTNCAYSHAALARSVGASTSSRVQESTSWYQASCRPSSRHYAATARSL